MNFWPLPFVLMFDYSLERTINLSVNATALHLKEDRPIDEVQQDLMSLSQDIVKRCLLENYVTLTQNLNVQTVVEVAAALQRAQISRELVKQLIEAKSGEGLKTFILQRASQEPHEGICDAVIVTPFQIPVTKEDNRLLALKSLTPFVEGPSDAPKEGTFHYSRLAKNMKGQGKPKPPCYKNTSVEMKIGTNDMKRLLRNPLRVSSDTNGNAGPKSIHKYSKSVPKHFHKDQFVLLPRLLAEYKKTDSIDKGLNQDVMYTVSATNFFASCGVYDYPIYGLTTNGSVGGVMVAWQSKTFGVCESY